jgi:CubicO group peptidase (beta-lactamase class C family)
VAKQFTATAIMMLVIAGKIGLDDPLSKYFPEAHDSPSRDVTVRHLLTHTSGLPDIYDEAGEFYGDFLQRRIFRPLTMTSTRIISEEDIVPNRVAGYRIIDGTLKNQEWIAPSLNTTADGGLYTNLIDLAKWDAALYTEKLLPRSAFEQMWTPVRLNSGATHAYGFGWALDTVNGHPLVSHTGSNQGFWISISRYRKDRLTVIVLTNLDSSHSSTLEIAEPVAAIYVPALKAARAQ